MSTLKKTIVAAALGVSALGVSAAPASAADLVSVAVVDQPYHDRDRYDDRWDRRDRWDRDRGRWDRDWDRDRDHWRHGRRWRDTDVVRRLSFDTRWRARIDLVEYEFERRGRDPRICEVSVRGPDSYRVPNGYLRSIAHRHCTPYARVRIDA